MYGLSIHGVTTTTGQTQVSSVSIKELKNAELLIIKWMQNDVFAKEIKVLQEMEVNTECKDRKFAKRKKATLKNSSCVYRLDPFLHYDGTFRVGGRIGKVSMNEDVKHPTILPKDGHLTTLIIRHFHEKVQHSARGITLNELHVSGYWVVSGNSAVRLTIAKCIRCRYLRGSVGKQKMTNLPESHLEPTPLFTYCAGVLWTVDSEAGS